MSNFKKIVEGYAGIQSPKSPTLLRAGAVLSSLSRIANFHRVKIVDGRTIDTFCNFYFLFMGKSGIGKDMCKNVFRRLDVYKAFIKDEIDECEQCEKKAVERHVDEYYKLYGIDDEEDDQGFKGGNGKDERKKALTYARGKLRRIQPVMSESTRPNLEAVGLEVVRHSRIGLTITNSEFLMWMKHKKSEAFEMFSFLADAYDNGLVNIKGTVMANRGAHEGEIEGLPLSAVLMSSEGLMSSNLVSDNLRDFFLQAGARRFCTASEPKLRKPLYTREEVEKQFTSKENEADTFLNKFVSNCRGGTKISIDKDVVEHMHERQKGREEMIEKKRNINELIEIEILGSTWRTLKIAGLLSMLNHNGSRIKMKDYMEAEKLNAKFLLSFQKIVGKHWVEDDVSFYDYIKDHKGCSKGDLYKLEIFARDKRARKAQYDDFIDVCSTIALSNDEELVVEKGDDGKTMRHTIKGKPKDLKNESGMLLNMSFSTDNARGYKPRKMSLTRACELMMNETKTNYCAGSFEGEHRLQANWLGGNNCLILDIDNDEGELLVTEAEDLFRNYTYIIQPTKSHKKDKSGKGIKERFRMIFPTEKMPKMDVRQFRNIMLNFHKVFGIEAVGDVKASGDTARYYYPSPHEAKIHEGEHMVNWRLYDMDIKENPKGVSAKVTGAHAGFFSKFSGLGIGEKERCHCPQHEDKNKSAFVTRNKNGNLQCCCSANCPTIFSN